MWIWLWGFVWLNVADWERFLTTSHACKNMWKFLWLWNKRDKMVPMQACVGNGGACTVQLHAPCFSWVALWVESLWTSAEAGGLFYAQESSKSGRIWPARRSVKWGSCLFWRTCLLGPLIMRRLTMPSFNIANDGDWPPPSLNPMTV